MGGPNDVASTPRYCSCPQPSTLVKAGLSTTAVLATCIVLAALVLIIAYHCFSHAHGVNAILSYISPKAVYISLGLGLIILIGSVVSYRKAFPSKPQEPPSADPTNISIDPSPTPITPAAVQEEQVQSLKTADFPYESRRYELLAQSLHGDEFLSRDFSYKKDGVEIKVFALIQFSGPKYHRLEEERTREVESLTENGMIDLDAARQTILEEAYQQPVKAKAVEPGQKQIVANMKDSYLYEGQLDIQEKTFFYFLYFETTRRHGRQPKLHCYRTEGEVEAERAHATQAKPSLQQPIPTQTGSFGQHWMNKRSANLKDGAADIAY